MRNPQPTPEEIVESLKRSSLPTVVTEGIDDYIVFRRLEERLSDLGVSVLPGGGRPSVLKIFERRSEFQHIKVAFIVDSDLWIFTGIPENASDSRLICTDGYSIENDLIRDGNLENFLFGHERPQYDRDVREACKWFSFAVSELLNGRNSPIDIHVDKILSNTGSIKTDFAEKIGYTGAFKELNDIIAKSPSRYLRGKTLMSILTRYLSYKGRVARHNSTSLLEGAAVNGGPYMEKIAQRIELEFRGYSTPASDAA